MTKQKLSGVYLVVDPSMGHEVLFDKVKQALEGGAGILQIWNHWPDSMRRPDKEQLITFIIEMAGKYDVPVLINDEWEFLQTTELHGVHFDTVPEDFDKIKAEIGRDFITGITCSNNLDIIKWADRQELDYISFCAMYPSPSVDSCDIVRPETVRKAREITDLPLFLSGGITPEKIDEFKELDYNGVAVISGILNSEESRQKTKEYKQALKEQA